MAKRLTKEKAKKILRDDEVRGHKLSKKQKRFFGAVAGGQRPRSKMPAGAHQSPKGDIGAMRQKEAAKAGGFTDGPIVKASAKL